MSSFKKIVTAAALMLALSSPVFAQGAAEKAAVDAGMEEQSVRFREAGAQVYHEI